MNNIFRSSSIRSIDTTGGAWRILLSFMLTAGTAASVHAQGQIASGTVTGSGSGPYTYNLSFSDAANATSPIGSVWYAWIPGAFYLPAVPTSVSAPAGWTATISTLSPTQSSIQFVANSAANDITPGHLLSGFSYQATFSPAQLAAAPNSGRSDAYSGGLFSDGGNIFTVQPGAVPEPSTLTLLIPGAIGFYLVGRRRHCAA